MRVRLGWILLVTGYLGLLNSLVLLNFLLNWTPSWLISFCLILIGAYLLKLRPRKVLGWVFVTSAVAQLIGCIWFYHPGLLVGVAIQAYIAYWLLDRTPFRRGQTNGS